MDRYTVYKYDILDSTNDKAWELLIEKRIRLPFVVRTKEQRFGRGRYGRRWVSGKGGLYFSIAEKDRFNNELLVCTTLAIHNTLKKYGIESRIILPNDIYTDRGKIAGILVERRGAFTVNGIGININQKSFEDVNRRATSMYLETGREYDLDSLFYDLLDEYFHLDFNYAFSQWKKLVMEANTHIKVFTRHFTGHYNLREIDRELNLYMDNLPLGKTFINLFDVIKIDTY